LYRRYVLGEDVSDVFFAAGLCRLNQVDPQPIKYSLSNP
jgi:hypothetical protein